MKRNLFAGRPRSGGFSLNVFTESETDDIHYATLEVLERTGVFVEDDEARDIFKDGGCTVDSETRVVKIPPHVVEDAVRSAPSKFVLCGRDPKNDFLMEPGRVAFTNFSEGIRVIDPFTGEYRESTLQDVADIARLNDYLSEMDTHEISVGAKEVPPETAAVHNTEQQLLNTTKPIGIGPLSGMECRAIYRMCAEVVGGVDELRARPIVYGGVCPVSPLKLPRDATEVIIESSRWGIPDNILSMAMAGGSSPVTLAGTMVTHNAEVLAGITLAQLTERGCPVIYGSSTTAMDLRLAAASVGSPEIAMISAAVAQMARRYLIPSFVAGLQADSKVGDAQTGHEKTLTGILAALAGANLIYGAGMIESGVTFDCGQFVMDNEFARMIKHSVGGIAVDDETLAVEDIAAVGPFGDFLSLDATMRHMREQSQPEFLDRRVREDWESRGSTDLYQRCLERAREIVREHKPEPLPDDVAGRIRAIVEETDRAAGVA